MGKKIKLSLCHEDICWSESTAQPFLTWVLDRGEWLDSLPGLFTPGDIVPGTYWLGDWVELITGLDSVEQRKILILSGFEARPSSP
jgi:hypothetical protein